MKFKRTDISGLLICEPRMLHDERGYFFESYNKKNFSEPNINFVQDNESYSKYGTLRGLHFQNGNSAQAKLVRVVKGKVLDVALDLRYPSQTFGRFYSVELSEENKKQLFIPRGFAHGFVVLSEDAILQYKCDNYYDKEAERGIIFSDPTIKIDWIIPNDHIITNERDKSFPTLQEYMRSQQYEK